MKTKKQIQKEYYKGFDVIEVLDKEAVKTYLNSSCASTWAQGPIDEDWFQLSRMSPSKKVDKPIAIICKTNLKKQLS